MSIMQAGIKTIAVQSTPCSVSMLRLDVMDSHFPDLTLRECQTEAASRMFPAREKCRRLQPERSMVAL